MAEYLLYLVSVVFSVVVGLGLFGIGYVTMCDFGTDIACIIYIFALAAIAFYPVYKFFESKWW